MDSASNNSTKVLSHKTTATHLDVKRRPNHVTNNENNISLKEMSYAPVNKKQRGTESESDIPLSTKVPSNSLPKAETSSPNSTPIQSTYPSKLLPAQNQRIQSSAKKTATPNDIGNDPPTSTVLLLTTPTVTPLFSTKKPTLGTRGVPELETAKETMKNQNNRAYLDQRKKQPIICSEEVDTKSSEYRNKIPTKISHKDLGTVHGKYDNKLRIVKYKNKKDSDHRKKKVTTTNANLPVLATINTKLSRRVRKTTTIHQQKQERFRS